MTDYQPPEPVPVDRREETVITQQPGYASSEEIVRDVAAERRIALSQVTRLIYLILGVLEALLGIRFVLKLIAANPASGFGNFIYGITAPFLAPFSGLLATPQTDGMILEVTTLVAMLIYALVFWGLVYVIRIIADRPSARSVTRSVREQGPDGVERTTHTTKR
jgi:uncharacterized membrane protein